MYYKINLNCSKCQKPTDIKLKHNIDGIKKLYFQCILKIHFKIIMGFYEEDWDYYLKELSIEKNCYYLLKDFDDKLNKKN